jgi:hypothetical protein
LMMRARQTGCRDVEALSLLISMTCHDLPF